MAEEPNGEVKRWTLHSASAALGLVIGAATVFVTILFFAKDTQNDASYGKKIGDENRAAIEALQKSVVDAVRDLTAKIESQNSAAISNAARIGAAEKAAEAANLVISNELRPQIVQLRENMVRSDANVVHLVEGVREVKELTNRILEKIDRSKEPK